MGMIVEKSENKSERQQLYENAYWQWYRSYECHYFEQEVQRLAKVSVPIKSGWLKAVRQAQMLSLKEVGHRLGVAESTYVCLEKSELHQNISMARLIEAANALDCEVVYFLRPKNNVRFSERVWRQLFKIFAKDQRVQAQPPERKHKALSTLIKQQMTKVKFRKQIGLAANSEGVPREYESQFV